MAWLAEARRKPKKRRKRRLPQKFRPNYAMGEKVNVLKTYASIPWGIMWLYQKVPRQQPSEGKFTAELVTTPTLYAPNQIAVVCVGVVPKNLFLAELS